MVSKEPAWMGSRHNPRGKFLTKLGLPAFNKQTLAGAARYSYAPHQAATERAKILAAWEILANWIVWKENCILKGQLCHIENYQNKDLAMGKY